MKFFTIFFFENSLKNMIINYLDKIKQYFIINYKLYFYKNIKIICYKKVS